MKKYQNFKIFLKSKWWFLLLVFAKAFRNSENPAITGTDFFDLLFLTGIILLILYIYWFLRYKRNKK